MIQIYNPDNTDYEHNGDMPLLPSVAKVHVVLNSTWAAELQHPIDLDGRWKQIVEGAVVKMPSFNGEQLFRVKKKYKSDSGIEAELDPIFYDAIDDCFLNDVRPTIKNGQDALNIMTSPNRKYVGQSDIKRVSTSYYIRKNLIEALNSDDENSFVNRWGGEILYDNYKVIVNDRVGGDYGVELRYGKNIEKDGLTEEIDIRNVVTRIYPTAYNGYSMSGTGYVDSPLIGSYPVVKTRTIKFEDVKMRGDASEDDEEKGIVICDTQAELDAELRKKCEDQYESGLDKPTVTISANMVLLKNTELYKDFQILEDVSIGDTIHCMHDRLEITTDARVVELRYDSIRQKVVEVTLGDFQGDYFDRVSSSVGRIDGVIDRNGNVMADRVAGILNGIQTQLRLQSTAAKKVEGRAFMVEDTDPDSPLYGCMVWGTQGLQISTQHTADGKDWDWTTAITAKGIVADAILTGIIADQTGTNYWNLDTGEFMLTSAAKIQTSDGEMSLSDYIKNQSAAAKSLQIITSRDFVGIPTDAQGNNGDYRNAAVTVQVYYGDDDISDQVTYSVTESSVSGSWDEANATYTVSNLTTDSGSVQIAVTYMGVITAKKVVQIAKVKSGETSPYRYMLMSAQTAKRDPSGAIIPSAFTVRAYQQAGSNTTPYAGRFKVEETFDGVTWSKTYESGGDETELEYELNNVIVDEHGNFIVTDKGLRISAGGINNVSSVRVSFYTDGGQLIDVQSLLVVSEAQQLTPEDVFNLLTDGGRIQGLYRIGNQIYMNASYIRSGTYVVGGINDEHGSIQILDVNGAQAGYISSSGIQSNNIEVGDSVYIYDRIRQNSVRIGFEEGTETFWISGYPVSIPTLISTMATINESVFNFVTVNQTLTIAEDANLQCNGSAIFNKNVLVMDLGVQKKLSAGNIESLGGIKSLTGDVVAGSVSLKDHVHEGIYNGTRSLVFDNTGSVQHIRTMNNGTVTNDEVNLGSNASKFKAVYASNGTIQTSDERKKDILGGFDDRYLRALKHLQPILYRWKNGDQELHAGFGAQSFEQALKTCGIHQDEMFAVRCEEGEYSLLYAEIIPLLTYGLIDLMKKVEGDK